MRDENEYMGMSQKKSPQELAERARMISEYTITKAAGNHVSAHRVLNEYLKLEPLQPFALLAYGENHTYAYGDTAFGRLNRAAVYLSHYQALGKVQLHYALGKAFSDVGEIVTAFTHFSEGGRSQREGKPYVNETTVELLRAIENERQLKIYSPAGASGYESNKPVILLGFPRRGKTLIEQILACHPDVGVVSKQGLLQCIMDGIIINETTVNARDYGCSLPHQQKSFGLDSAALSFKERGERYVQALEACTAPSVRRIVDKGSCNYVWAGLLPDILPNARIINFRYHPAEACLSCFRSFFPEGLPWAGDLRAMGKAFRAYHDHMRILETLLPKEQLLTLRYEEAVADMAGTVRHIIDHSGLTWDDRCLNFYDPEWARKRSPHRKGPSYTIRMNRWRTYEAYLKPLLEEIGDLISEYEGECAATVGTSESIWGKKNADDLYRFAFFTYDENGALEHHSAASASTSLTILEAATGEEGLMLLDRLAADKLEKQTSVNIVLLGGGGMGTTTMAQIIGSSGVGGVRPDEVDIVDTDCYLPLFSQICSQEDDTPLVFTHDGVEMFMGPNNEFLDKYLNIDKFQRDSVAIKIRAPKAVVYVGVYSDFLLRYPAENSDAATDPVDIRVMFRTSAAIRQSRIFERDGRMDKFHSANRVLHRLTSESPVIPHLVIGTDAKEDIAAVTGRRKGE
jgi:hypothetical protein